MGVGVMQTKNAVLLKQSAYTKALLSRFGMDKENSIATPVDVNADLVTTSDEVEECEKYLYQSAVVKNNDFIEEHSTVKLDPPLANDRKSKRSKNSFEARHPLYRGNERRDFHSTTAPAQSQSGGHQPITQQTLPKPLTSSIIKELETKAAPRLTANETLHNHHSGVHKALPERSTKLTTEDPNVQSNSVPGILNTPAHTGPTASATPASNKRGETTNNEEDCQWTAEVLRSTVTWPVQDSEAKHHLAYTNMTSTRVPTQISGQGNVSNSVSFDGSLHPLQIKS
ncbi:hypothetical protein FHG87_018973 [Trinorchestia longiramus]|nr:hypothetical protein FHG87_018973 [Trinorchestia longiramus]